MSIPARQSTALELSIGPVLDADGVAVTGCVVGDFKIKKTTGNFAALNASATLTHVSAGTYDLVLTTSDTDTVGLCSIAIDDTTNACAPVYLQVMEEAVYDALYAASANAFTGAAGSSKISGVVLVDTLTALAASAITRAAIAADTGLQSTRSNTAQAGANGSITLDASASAVTNFYLGQIVYITGGTGVGQSRPITDYNGTTKVASVTFDWKTNPDNTSTFAILPPNLFDLHYTTLVMDVVDTRTADILTQVGTAGAGLTAIGDTRLANLNATVSSRASQTSVDDLPTNAELATALGTADDAVLAAIAALNNLSAADVNAQVLDCLATDTYAEPGQGTPAATTTLAVKINYLYKLMRNKFTQTSTTQNFYADDASTVDHKATVSDDGSTFTRGEIASGP